MIIDKIRNAVAEGKNSGSERNITLTYNISPSILLNETISTRSEVTPSQFRVEVSNALGQWVKLINGVYSGILVVGVQEITTPLSAPQTDIIISSGADGSYSAFKGNNLNLNLDLPWYTSNMIRPLGGHSLLSHFIYNLGCILGVSPEVGGNFSPMNYRFLKEDYVVLLDINVFEDGTIDGSYLNQFNSVINSLQNSFGSPDKDIQDLTGCTDPTATNYNPAATINAGCEGGAVISDARPEALARTGNAGGNAVENSSFILLTAQDFFKVTDSVLGEPTPILDGAGTTTFLQGLTTLSSSDIYISLVITDRNISTFYQYMKKTPIGDIKYFVVISASNQVFVYNSAGQLASNTLEMSLIDLNNGTGSVGPSEDAVYNFKSVADKIRNSLNISYSYDQDKHNLCWTDVKGRINKLVLDDSLDQTNSGGELVSNCTSDTLSYGNISSYTLNTLKTFYDPQENSSSSETAHTKAFFHRMVDGKINYLSDYFKDAEIKHQELSGQPMISTPGRLGTSVVASDKIEGVQSVSARGIMFEIPTIAGIMPISVDRFSSILEIPSGGNVGADPRLMCLHGDHAAHDLSGSSRHADTVYDYSPFLIKENRPGIHLLPFSGFSFDSWSYGINSARGASIRARSAASPGFTMTGGVASTHGGEHARKYTLPVAVGNKLVRNYQTTDPSKFSHYVSSVAEHSYGSSIISHNYSEAEGMPDKIELAPIKDYNYVGSFHVALAVSNGVMILKFSNTSLRFVSPSNGGSELLIPCALPHELESVLNNSLEYRPDMMVFSPDDNFLYVVTTERGDSSLPQKIFIFPINSGTAEGCTATDGLDVISNAYSVENGLSGEIERISLTEDGSIYIWSTSNEYYKIPDSHFLSSVQNFANTPTNNKSTLSTPGAPKSMYPTSSYKKLNEEGLRYENNVTMSTLDQISKDPRYIYQQVYNSNRLPINKGAGHIQLTNPEFNSKIVTPGFTHNLLTNEYIKNTENNKSFWAASASQTSDAVDTDILFYAAYEASSSAVEKLFIKDYDGARIKSFSSSATDVDFSRENSIFILPLYNDLGHYIVAYAARVEEQYIYKGILIKAASSGDIIDPFTYKLFDTATEFNLEPLLTDGKVFARGAGIIKDVAEKKSFLYKAYYKLGTETRKEETFGSEGTEVFISVREYSDARVSGEGVDLDAFTQDPVQIVSGHTHNLGGIHIDSSVDFEIEATFAFSKDLKYLAIGTSDPYTGGMTITIHKLTNNKISGKIGSTINYNNNSGTSKLNNFSSPHIKSLEFSPNGSILYILAGERSTGYATQSVEGVDYPPLLLDMGESRQSILTALKIDTDLPDPEKITSLGEVPAITRYEVTDSSARSFSDPQDSQEIFTSTEGMSNAGETLYETASNMQQLASSVDGNILIHNVHLNRVTTASDENKYIKHIGGVITSPNNSSSFAYSKTSTVILADSKDDATYGARGFTSNQSHSKAFQDFEDDLDVARNYSVHNKTYGCTDRNAENFDPDADISNGDCFYGSSRKYTEEGGCPAVKDRIPWVALRDTELMTQLLQETGTQIRHGNRTEWSWGIPQWYPRTGLYRDDDDTQHPDRITAHEVISEETFYNEACAQCYSKLKVRLTIKSRWATNFVTDLGRATHHVNVNFLWREAPSEQDTKFPKGSLAAGNTTGVPFLPIYNQANFMLESPDHDYDYCLNCTKEDGLKFGGYTSSECIPPYCVEDLSLCGVGGCTDATACNYNADADWNNGSCFYVKTGCNCEKQGTANARLMPIRIPLADLPYEPVDLISKGIDGNGDYTSPGGRFYCGDCHDNEEMTIPTKGCGCDDTPNAINMPAGHTGATPEGGWEYYCNCEGSVPSARATDGGCKCDSNGELKIKAQYIAEDGSPQYQGGYCGCKDAGPTTSSQPIDKEACNCAYEVMDSEINCNCALNINERFKKVQYFYPKNSETPGYAECGGEVIKACLVPFDTGNITDWLTEHHPGSFWLDPIESYYMPDGATTLTVTYNPNDIVHRPTQHNVYGLDFNTHHNSVVDAIRASEEEFTDLLYTEFATEQEAVQAGVIPTETYPAPGDVILYAINITTRPYTIMSYQDLVENYYIGPINQLSCTKCATDAEISEFYASIIEEGSEYPTEQSVNCSGDCEFKLVNEDVFEYAGVSLNRGDIYRDLNWQDTILNACDECVLRSNGNEGCCPKAADGSNQIDACGSCTASEVRNPLKTIKTTLGDDGVYTISLGDEEAGTAQTASLGCSPCQDLQASHMYDDYSSGYDAFLKIKDKFILDGCGVCGADIPRKFRGSEDQYYGYYTYNSPTLSGGSVVDITYVACNCVDEGVPLQGVGTTCCSGYQYDECLEKCISKQTPLTEKVCDTCPGPNGIYPREENGCGECADKYTDPDTGEYVLMQTFNDVGCCGSQIKGECIPEGMEGQINLDMCFDPGEEPRLDHCDPAVCNGDGSTCSGCTDPDAHNYDPTASGDSVGCRYEDLYDIATQIHSQINLDGEIVDSKFLKASFFLDISKSGDQDLHLIASSKNIIAAESENVVNSTYYKDALAYTDKVQQIGRDNPRLIIENPANNAEIQYTNQHIALTTHNQYRFFEEDAIIHNVFSAHYYFRLIPTINLTHYGAFKIFRAYGEYIQKIEDAAGNVIVGRNNAGAIFYGDDLKVGTQGTYNSSTNASPSSATIFNIYKLTPKIDPDTGQPYKFIIDFSDFFFEEVYGCTNPLANNYNLNATVNDGSCTFGFENEGYSLVFINKGVTETTKLRWVIYNYKNEVIYYGDDSVFFKNFELNYPIKQNLLTGKMSGCTYFIPIGFKNYDQWQNVKFYILRDNEVEYGASHGAEIPSPWTDDHSGTIVLKKDIKDGECTIGCTGDLVKPSIVKTEKCTAYVKADDGEFTDITFTAEVGVEEFHVDPLGNPFDEGVVNAEIIDLDTGNTLLKIELEVAKQQTSNFGIDKNTRIGIMLDFNGLQVNASAKYKLVSEYGTIITKKEHTVDSKKTFDAVTIELRKAGCTDPKAANYDVNALISSEVCYNSAFESCVENILFNVSLRDCSTSGADDALKLFAVHEGYKQAIRENNKVKIDIYSQQILDMCNAKHCATC